MLIKYYSSITVHGFILRSTPLNLNGLFCVCWQVKCGARPYLVITGVAWHFHQVALLKQDTSLNPRFKLSTHNCSIKVVRTSCLSWLHLAWASVNKWVDIKSQLVLLHLAYVFISASYLFRNVNNLRQHAEWRPPCCQESTSSWSKHVYWSNNDQNILTSLNTTFHTLVIVQMNNRWKTKQV